MKIFAAIKQIEFALKLFAAAGFTGFASAMESKNELALKEHMASMAKVEKVVEKLVEPTEEQMTALISAELREQAAAAGITLAANQDPIQAIKDGHATLTALQTRMTLIETTLSACGIKLTASDAKAGLTAADITRAVETRVSAKGAELTALLGTPPVKTEVTNDSKRSAGKTDTAELKGLARVTAAFTSQTAAKQIR